jgi:hypothetical protein
MIRAIKLQRMRGTGHVERTGERRKNEEEELTAVLMKIQTF